MKQLVELNSAAHRDLKVADGAAVEFARGQHVMQLRAAEIGHAVSSFPVFGSRSPTSGQWVLSIVTGLEPGDNLFVTGDRWSALYEPMIMQTCPLYLMQVEGEADRFVVGIDADSDAFSTEHGTSLFDSDGTPSLYLNELTAKLQANVEHDQQTALFTRRLDELGLFRSINIDVVYDDNRTQTITGLHSVNEDRLQSLEAAELAALNRQGYLLPIHGMLMSIFQLNRLVRRHNERQGNAPIRNVKLEVARDPASAGITQ